MRCGSSFHSARIGAREHEYRQPFTLVEGQAIVIAETEERGHAREVVRGEFVWPIHLEQLNETPAAKLGKTIGGSHAVVMRRAGSQSEAQSFIPRGRAIEVANSQHHMID